MALAQGIEQLRKMRQRVRDGLPAVGPSGPVMATRPKGPIPVEQTGNRKLTPIAREAPYGLREDGTPKGEGYFGKLPMQDGSGRFATELSADADVGGKHLFFPLIVPTLTRDEIDHLLAGKNPTQGIYNKAIDHALGRIKLGKSPFAGKDEQPTSSSPLLTRAQALYRTSQEQVPVQAYEKQLGGREAAIQRELGGLLQPGQYPGVGTVGTIGRALIDPGFLLSPENLLVGAGSGAILAGSGLAQRLAGALKGTGLAAGGAVTPAAQFGRGVVKGLTEPIQAMRPPLNPAIPEHIRQVPAVVMPRTPPPILGKSAPSSRNLPSLAALGGNAIVPQVRPRAPHILESPEAVLTPASASPLRTAEEVARRHRLPPEQAAIFEERLRASGVSPGQASVSTFVPPPPPGQVASVPPGANVPPLNPLQPAATQTWRQYASQTMRRLQDRLPSELPLIRRVPNSPVISDVERHGVQMVTRLDALLHNPLATALWKYTPEQWHAFEAEAVRRWNDGGRTVSSYAAALQHLPPEFQQMVQHRAAQFQADQAAREALDLPAIPESTGPYFPRLTDQAAREVFTVFNQGAGLRSELQTTVKSFQKSRVYASALEGLSHGVVYEDPRKAWLMREWMSIKLQETATLLKGLEGRVLFPSREAAIAHSPIGQAFPIEGLPLKRAVPEGSNLPTHFWWATSREEALFLKQNVDAKEGRLGTALFLANQAFRNPNLVNPLPHIVKNMWVKYAMARGSLNPTPLFKDAREYLHHLNPALIAEFQQVMPFSPHGETAQQLLLGQMPALAQSRVGQLAARALNTATSLNRLSSRFIFSVADPAMRYSLWKWYRGKGLSAQEAANQTWVDLIRYGTRSELVDTWKSIPLNFFVPWRIGSLTSILKNLSGPQAPSRLVVGVGAKGLSFALSPLMRPIRTAMIIGAVELGREAYYRDTGRTFHIPFDYVDGPITRIVDDPKQAVYVAATMLALGPGGEAAAKNIADTLHALRGKPDWNQVKMLYWGLSQAYDMGEAVGQAILNGDTGKMVEALKIAALAEHDTYGYEPQHLAKYLPEWMPAMEKSQLVQTAEARRRALLKKGEINDYYRQKYRELRLAPSQRP